MRLPIDLQSSALERVENALDVRGPEDDRFVRALSKDAHAITSETESAHSLDPDHTVEGDLHCWNETRQEAAGFTPTGTKGELFGLYEKPRKGR